MGVVYLAEHLRLKRKVALKVLAPELSGDERFRSRFLVEAELAASLDHPNVVTVFDAGEAGGQIYIAMRLVEGTDLKTLIERDGPLDPGRAAGVIQQVASALDAAHAKGLIHRDVKPANVLMARDGDGSDHAYLTDFGLTKRPDQTSGLTRTGQFMGSVDYAAPEQFEGKPLDARTDVYSLACVAFESLTGEVPYRRDQEAAVMYAHLREAPPKPSARLSGLPAAVDVVLGRGMGKRPEERYPSAGGFALAFRDAMPGAPAAARVERRERRPLLLAAGALVVGAAVISAVAVLTRHGAARPPGRSPTPGAAIGTSGPGPAPGTVGVVRLDPATGERLATIDQSLARSDVPFDKSIITSRGFVWLYDSQSSTLYKISPQTNQVINDLSVLGGSRVASGDQSLWIAPDFFSGNGTLVRIDPGTVSIEKSISIAGEGSCCVDTGFGEGTVWSLASQRLVAVDPRTNEVRDVFDVGGTDIAFAPGKVWVLNIFGQMVPIDPGTGRQGTPLALPGNPLAMTVSHGSAWVVDKGSGAGVVHEIPLSGGGGIVDIPVGSGPNDIFASADSVWVPCAGDGTVWRIDAATNEATMFSVGGHPTQIAVGEGGAWVVMEPASNVFG